ncbi:MAG: sugar nucleotide-binding protein [Flavobacteriaceae bacterium]|nr:sugar nucleotide-binding protein [Flavobacteriaceae bacterium]
MANRILILGASGFIGNTIYKELTSYFDVYGTYNTANKALDDNNVMFQFNVEKDNINDTLKKVNPNYIISSLRGPFKDQLRVHQELLNYTLSSVDCKIIYLSTVNVFDGKGKFPSYENDSLLADSQYGKYKVMQEKAIYKLPNSKFAILRLPLVLGVNSPRIIQLKEASKNKTDFEVYPNMIISISTANKIAQQIHYIINKDLSGIYHLSSNDMIHHSELFEEITNKLELKNIVFKNIFKSNKDQYLAILPKYNKLPENYQITTSQVIEDCLLKDEISSLK